MSNWDAKTAEWYAERYGEYATNRLGIAALTFSADATVVDIGCGTGSALRHAAEQVSTGRLIGVDPVPRMVEIAREHTAKHAAADRIVFFEGRAESLPVESKIADWVLAFDSYDHWGDHVAGLQEVQRILKPTGLLAIVKDGGVPNGAKSSRALAQTLNQAGFTILSEKTIEQDEIKFTQWVCRVTD